jgi:hypothetical protein
MQVITRKSVLAAALVAIAVIPIPVAAQIESAPPSYGQTFALELWKPFFDEFDEGFTTSVLRGRLLQPAWEGGYLIADLSLAHGRVFGESSWALSNPELGVAFAGAGGDPIGEVTVMLPLAREFGGGDFGAFVGFLHEATRFERFVEDIWSVNGVYTPTVALDGGALVGLRLGGSVLFPPDGEDTELLARYGASVAGTSDRIRMGGEVTGVAIVSERDLSFNERTIHQMTLLLGIDRDGVVPDLLIRIPLESSVRDAIPVSVGIRLTF